MTHNFKLKYLAGITLAAAALCSCESLDYTPGDQMSGQNFWQTEDHARQAAIGMYAAMKSTWCFGLEFTFDMCSDLADGTSPLGRYFARHIVRLKQLRSTESLAVSL